MGGTLQFVSAPGTTVQSVCVIPDEHLLCGQWGAKQEERAGRTSSRVRLGHVHSITRPHVFRINAPAGMAAALMWLVLRSLRL